MLADRSIFCLASHFDQLLVFAPQQTGSVKKPKVLVNEDATWFVREEYNKPVTMKDLIPA